MSKEFQREIDEYQVNTQVYRIRKLLLSLRPYGNLFTGVIERRTGELRFAHPFFRIEKEGRPLGEILPS